MAKKIVEACYHWENFIKRIRIAYTSVENKLQEYYKNLRLDHLKSDPNADEISKMYPNPKPEVIVVRLISKILMAKSNLIERIVNNYHKIVTSKELRKKLEEDNWVSITINPKIYNVLGYVVYGNRFTESK